ncbi:hypothetical protein [Granulicella tundricola]|uniref:O-antigen polymerase n=1 Tax=Granulicella tundricola (strain ATCC BAA-1859 / DSM 23138 / MP5ACTX9) TaxID=1198114 RepID=E8X0G1_GRATM|nr:hypothetical protein [Granulicella tundricola]ADW67825.1 hypothetical protein AciX9_0756 [Granulicella tundricola MP5ACTX9]
MRLPIPDRFPPKQVILFAVCLFVAQVLEGTSLTFALLLFVYVLLAGLAFNLAGGIAYPSGAWIFFTATLTCLIGFTYKVLLGQPGESHLRAPLVTMSAYCIGMAGMAAAAYVCTAIRPREGLLANLVVGERMKQAAIGCFIFGTIGTFASLATNTADSVGAATSSGVTTAFAQLNHFVQMAIILGTTYQIAHSKGKSSTNWIVWCAGLLLFFFGVASYSKEGMFVSLLSWLVPCIAMRFDFSKKQLISGVCVLVFMFYYLVPFSQYGRRSRGDAQGLLASALIAGQYLTHLEETRKLYLEAPDVTDLGDQPHLYDTSEGFFDRLQMIAWDDLLIDYTQTNQTIGFGAIGDSFLNVIPHFIWANKPVYGQANLYGRQLGFLSEDDTTTGISFSPVGDGFYQGSWIGVGFVLPLLMLFMFLVADSLSGDVRKAPWGLLFIAISAHYAPEGMLVGVVWMATLGAEVIIFSALLSAYVLPRIIILLSGGEKTRVRATQNFVLGAPVRGVMNRNAPPLRPEPGSNAPPV